MQEIKKKYCSNKEIIEALNERYESLINEMIEPRFKKGSVPGMLVPDDFRLYESSDIAALLKGLGYVKALDCFNAYLKDGNGNRNKNEDIYSNSSPVIADTAEKSIIPDDSNDKAISAYYLVGRSEFRKALSEGYLNRNETLVNPGYNPDKFANPVVRFGFLDEYLESWDGFESAKCRTINYLIESIFKRHDDNSHDNSILLLKAPVRKGVIIDWLIPYAHCLGVPSISYKDRKGREKAYYWIKSDKSFFKENRRNEQHQRRIEEKNKNDQKFERAKKAIEYMIGTMIGIKGNANGHELLELANMSMPIVGSLENISMKGVTLVWKRAYGPEEVRHHFDVKKDISDLVI